MKESNGNKAEECTTMQAAVAKNSLENTLYNKPSKIEIPALQATQDSYQQNQHIKVNKRESLKKHEKKC